MAELVRIQKLLSDSGVASRRAIEQMILDARITVNGDLVNKLPCFVDPIHDDIRVDDQPVKKRPARRMYFLLNKPRDVVCSGKDCKDRRLAAELVPCGSQHVFCVGQLDVESSGLVILTNDGELTAKLTKRTARLEKIYVVEVAGIVTGEIVQKLKDGIWLDGRRSSGAAVKILSRENERSILELRLVETHNRQVRRSLAALGHKVRKMKRTSLGPITDRGVKIGNFRPLSDREISALLDHAEYLDTGVRTPRTDRRERKK